MIHTGPMVTVRLVPAARQMPGVDNARWCRHLPVALRPLAELLGVSDVIWQPTRVARRPSLDCDSVRGDTRLSMRYLEPRPLPRGMGPTGADMISPLRAALDCIADALDDLGACVAIAMLCAALEPGRSARRTADALPPFQFEHTAFHQLRAFVQSYADACRYHSNMLVTVEDAR